MFIDKRNEYPAERATKTREHHAELDYHNRRLQDKKNEFHYLNYLTTWRVTIISPVTNSVGDNQWAISDKLNSAGYLTQYIIQS